MKKAKIIFSNFETTLEEGASYIGSGFVIEYDKDNNLCLRITSGSQTITHSDKTSTEIKTGSSCVLKEGDTWRLDEIFGILNYKFISWV